MNEKLYKDYVRVCIEKNLTYPPLQDWLKRMEHKEVKKVRYKSVETSLEQELDVARELHNLYR